MEQTWQQQIEMRVPETKPLHVVRKQYVDSMNANAAAALAAETAARTATDAILGNRVKAVEDGAVFYDSERHVTLPAGTKLRVAVPGSGGATPEVQDVLATDADGNIALGAGDKKMNIFASQRPAMTFAGGAVDGVAGLRDLAGYAKATDVDGAVKALGDSIAANFVKAADFEGIVTPILDAALEDFEPADLANFVKASALTGLVTPIVTDAIDEALEDFEPADLANFVKAADFAAALEELEEDMAATYATGADTANAVAVHNVSALAHNGVDGRTEDIEEKIPAQASGANQLADRAFVNSSINSLAAWKLYKSALQEDFATAQELKDLAALETAANLVFFRADGELHHSTPNDYVVIMADEDNGGGTTRWKNFLQDDGASTVWGYDMPLGGGAAFTADQMAAINSGVTEEIVDGVKNLPKHVAFVTTPDYTNMDPTEHGPGPWTADKDGFVLIDCGSSSSSMGLLAYINEKRVFYGVYQADAVLPISAGDVIRISFSGSGRKSIFYIPPKYSPAAAAFALAPNSSAQDTTNQMPGDTDTYTVAQDGFVNVTRTGDAGSPQTIYLDGVAVAVGLGTVSFYENVDEGSVVSWSGNGFVSGSCYYVPPKYVPVNRQYSTDEQLTGETWIDGRPVWRRVYNTTAASAVNTYKTIDSSISTSHIIIRFGGSLNNGVNAAVYPLPYEPNIIVNVVPAGLQMLHTQASYNNKPINLIVEYVKP